MIRALTVFSLALLSCASPWDTLRDRSRQCTATRRDCDNDPVNGCEADIASDRHHCGECATVAPVACSQGRSLELRSIAGAAGTQCVSLRGEATHSIRCWGSNEKQQAGPQPAATAAIPVDPQPNERSEVHALSVGDGFACAIRGDVRTLSCWGSAITLPMLGPTEQLLSLTALAAGARHGCVAVPRSGTDESVVRCFGDNDRGQLGGEALAPFNVSSVRAADATLLAIRSLRGLAAGASHTCAFNDSAVYCWGSNDQQQLGRDALPGVSATGAAIVALGDVRVIDVAAGGESTCAIVTDAPVIGDDASADATTDAAIEAGSATDAQSNEASCRASSAGAGGPRVVCWGAIRRGSSCGALVATVLREDGAPLEDTARVFVGSTHACAITNRGETYCWGRGDSARFAGATVTESMTAARVEALRGARELSIVGAGNVLPISARTSAREGFCALFTTGSGSTVKCWGPNDRAQLGDSARGAEVLSIPSEVRW